MAQGEKAAARGGFPEDGRILADRTHKSPEGIRGFCVCGGENTTGSRDGRCCKQGRSRRPLWGRFRGIRRSRRHLWGRSRYTRGEAKPCPCSTLWDAPRSGRPDGSL